ncbi:hypothetical protein ACCO45_007916 [Purpureocillium lilacinum]|uniref:Uncharacterized protein n=1 Tax=Purpureocillium lilacinum TaxID=33203 RepID=A0ACC4DPX7_PURLI
MASPAAPIPITIITGFLGSGKTTLILNLIPQLRARSPNYRLALLKNEFGDLAVDSQLASSSAISGVQELLNGCICCNLVGQLGPALAELEKTVTPDRIVVETSGSAFPATLALEVNRLARDSGRYVLDGVISVVDVENWQGYEDTSYTAKIQARYTDLIVFNKWEAAGEDRYEECLDRVGDLDVDVAKVKSTKGWVDMDIPPARSRSSVHRATCPGRNPFRHRLHRQAPLLLKAAPKDEAYRIKAVLTLSSPPTNSDPDVPAPGPSPSGRYILNWAFGRWIFTPVAATQQEHASSSESVLRMTMILGRYESGKWKKRIEAGGFVQLGGHDKGELSVKRIL